MSIKRLAVLILPTLFVGTVLAQTEEQYCEIQLSKCPSEYDGVTLNVPLSVVSLSAQIRACADTTLQSVRISKPSAVMFVIDHSTTMVPAGANPNECAGGCDPTGNRYRVTKEIIDSINAINPESEVGIVVFSNGLVLDSDRDANLVRFTGADASDTFGVRQSYMPLKQLKAQAMVGGTNPFYTGTGSPTIYDVYRNMFVQNAGTGGWGIKSGPAEISGTNISLAFAAALKAFEGTNIDKDNQYIVFLSDGEASLTVERSGGACPNNTSSYIWCSRKNDFMVGANTPTTYTVFLRPGANAQIPSSIRTMTNNISTNGYSYSNPSSAAVTISSNYQSLLDMLKNMILEDMPTDMISNARRISVTSAGRTDSTDNIDNVFTFARTLPIDTVELAPVKMGITYLVQGDTLLPDGRDSSYSFYRLNEYNFQIQRTVNPPNNWATSQGLLATCGGKQSIKLIDRVVPQVKPPEEATVIAPVVILAGEFTAGPNPVSRLSESVNFYRQGKHIAASELRIYDANGNVINKVKINDKAIGTQARRQVGTWNLCDRNGRTVPEGTYLVKGVVKTDGKSEKVSVILSVR